MAGNAGDLMVLRLWQRRLLGHLFARRADGRLRHRTGLIGMPRKNGKSGIGSGLALDGLLFTGNGSDVFSCAGDKDQARLVFGETKWMIEADAELSEVCKPQRDVIEVPLTNSVYRVLSAEAYTKEGLNPKRTIFDEVHVQPNDELWNVMALAMAARTDPLLIGITTAGVMTQPDGAETVCYRMFRHGLDVIAKRVDDPSFFMAWWGAPSGADHTDPAVWKAANPGYGDLIDPEDFEAAILRTPENEFRTKRLNQWVAAVQAWLPAGTWEACAEPDRRIPDGVDVVLAFDGSKSHDTTVLIAVMVDERPHIEVVGAWERPSDADPEWRVPRSEVKDAVRAACRRWQVREIAWDEFLWLDAAEELEEEGLPVVEFPQNMSRMGPATQRFYEAVVGRAISHSGDPVLSQHVANAVLKTDLRGSRLVKDHRGSARKIDAAVAAVMGLDRAASVPPRKTPRVIDLAEVLRQAGDYA